MVNRMCRLIVLLLSCILLSSCATGVRYGKALVVNESGQHPYVVNALVTKLSNYRADERRFGLFIHDVRTDKLLLHKNLSLEANGKVNVQVVYSDNDETIRVTLTDESDPVIKYQLIANMNSGRLVSFSGLQRID